MRGKTLLETTDIYNGTFLEQSRKINLKEIVHPKMNICSKCTHPHAIQDVDEFVSSSEM